MNPFLLLINFCSFFIQAIFEDGLFEHKISGIVITALKHLSYKPVYILFIHFSNFT